jgi:hypothetical protein
VISACPAASRDARPARGVKGTKEDGMTEQGPRMDLDVWYLTALRGELTGRGMRCELADHGITPRLRVYPPGETGSGEEFDNNIVAVPFGGGWFYCWPWAEPIGPVTRPAQAAQAILADLGLGGDDSDEADVLPLTARRMLERARHSVFPAPTPGPVPRLPTADRQARGGGPPLAGRDGSNGQPQPPPGIGQPGRRPGDAIGAPGLPGQDLDTPGPR